MAFKINGKLFIDNNNNLYVSSLYIATNPVFPVPAGEPRKFPNSTSYFSGGTVAGFIGGPLSPSGIERFAFATDTNVNASPWGSSGFAAGDGYIVGNWSSTDGFFSGGKSGPTFITQVLTRNKFPFASSVPVSATPLTALTPEIYFGTVSGSLNGGGGSFSSSTDGYVFGQYINKFPFSDPTNPITLLNGISSANHYKSPSNAPTPAPGIGLNPGSWISAPDWGFAEQAWEYISVGVATKVWAYAYASDNPMFWVGDVDTSRVGIDATAGTGSLTHGYSLGGANYNTLPINNVTGGGPPTNLKSYGYYSTTTKRKFAFSSNVKTSFTSDLINSRLNHCVWGSLTAAYVTGGESLTDPATSPTQITAQDKFPFAADASISSISTLSNGATKCGSFQD
jgi:hypothetical protein